MERRKGKTPLLTLFILFILNSSRTHKFSYYASSGTFTTEHTSSLLHEKMVSTLSDGFTLPRSRLPPNVKSKVSVVRNLKSFDFSGAYLGSEKVPDLAFLVTNDKGLPEVRFVVEVGFSETYNSLMVNAKLWLEGTETVSLVLLAKLEETPTYKCPIKDLSDEEFAELAFPDLAEIRNEPFTISSPSGPAIYKDLVWMGKISGFLEPWKIDPLTKSATPGSRIVSHSLRNVRYSSLPI